MDRNDERNEGERRKQDVLQTLAARDWLARHPDQPDQGPDAAGSPVTAPINPNNGTGPAVAQPSLF
jgi:hypothetical protein